MKSVKEKVHQQILHNFDLHAVFSIKYELFCQIEDQIWGKVYNQVTDQVQDSICIATYERKVT